MFTVPHAVVSHLFCLPGPGSDVLLQNDGEDSSGLHQGPSVQGEPQDRGERADGWGDAAVSGGGAAVSGGDDEVIGEMLELVREVLQ